MFRVIRKCEFGVIGQDEFFTFEEAKIQFRNIIKEKLGDGIEDFTAQIDLYCSEFYPDGAPEEFAQLKELLTKLATDPKFPEKSEDLKLDDFEDDNVEFYIGPYSNICVYVNNDEVKEKFLTAEINVVEMDDPDEEYYFFITDNRSVLGDKHFLTNITLETADEFDDDFVDFDGFIDFDDIDDDFDVDDED